MYGILFMNKRKGLLTMNEIKLLPCAHCGSTDVHLIRDINVEVDATEIYAPTTNWHVECYECGMSTQMYDEETNSGDADISDYEFAKATMDDAVICAVEAWNRRAETPIKACETSACDNLSSMSNNELVALIKRATDALTNKADDLLTEICDLIRNEGEENNG